MDPQLTRIRKELDAATVALKNLVAGLPQGAWDRRPAEGVWSIGHCVAHLNITSREFLPCLDKAIHHGRDRHLVGKGPFRRDFMGWVLCQFMEPPYKTKVETPAKFDPQEVPSKEQALAEWDRWQGELQERIYAADGLALSKLQVVSPFSERVKYNLWSAFVVIPSHQRRHIWQAKQILTQF